MFHLKKIVVTILIKQIDIIEKLVSYENIKKIIISYGLGLAISLLIIGIIHLYSLIDETYFCYAQWDNILVTALISGFPFGVALWAFITLKNTK